MVGESVADAYALIRHYQRYGTDEDLAESRISPANRALDMIMRGSNGHFTSFVTDEIIRLKDKINFNLSPEDTARLARRFAKQYMPSQPVIDDLYRTFAPLKRDNAVETLVNITLSPNVDSYAFKLGSVWLKDLIQDDRIKRELPPQYLADIAKKLKEKEFSLEADGILFNFPAAQKKPAAAVQPPANQNGAPPPRNFFNRLRHTI